MTKDEWRKAEEALQQFFTTVKINADGYELILRLERIGTYKNAVMVYINGEFRGEWLARDCEERKRFMHKKTRSLLSTKEMANYKKLTKRQQKELAERYNDLKYDSYSPQWPSFGSLKRHLIANKKDIQLIQIG